MAAIAYRREIDGLRAIAVLSVVLYHASALPAAGFVGVDVFFVISGYLITSILLREHAVSGRIDLAGFYARRVRRILPAVALLVVVVTIIARLVLPPAAFAEMAASAAASMAFVANVFFAWTSGGYFDRSAEQLPLLHLWSLGVEEQFYLLWPLLLAIVLHWRARWLPVAIVVLGVASLLLAEMWLRGDPQSAFYQMPARFWELAAGGFVASRVPRPAHRWLATAGIVLVMAACCWPLPHFPGFGALPAVAGSALLLRAVHGGGDTAWAGAALRSRPMVFVGLVSYSLYLWHWPLLALLRATAIGGGSLATRLGLCALAFAIAVASWRYVEQPFRRMRTPKQRTLVAGVMAACLLALGAHEAGVHARAEEGARPTDDPLAVKAENDLPPDRLRCHYTVYDTVFPRPDCATIPGRRPSVVLWGDSMALAWQPVAWRIAQSEQASAIGYTRDSCVPLLDYLPAEASPGQRKCREFNAKVAAERDPGDTLVLAAHWPPFADWDGWAALRTTLRTLAPRVRRIIVVGPSPELGDDAPKCLRAHAPERCAIPRDAYEAQAAPVRAALAAAMEGLPNVSMLDPSDFLCTTRLCPIVRDGVVLYRDRFHVTYTAAGVFAATACGPACGAGPLTRDGAGTKLKAP